MDIEDLIEGLGFGAAQGAMLLVILLLFLVILLVGVAVYVLTCYPLHKALSYLGYKTPWLAWIPFANVYAMSDYTVGDREEIQLLGKTVKGQYYRYWILGLVVYAIVWPIICSILGFICGIIPIIGWIAGILLSFIIGIVGILVVVLEVYLLGVAYAQIIADVERVPASDKMVVGIVSGVIPLVASVILLIDFNKIKKGEL